ncbi:MAG: EVE domain-containing protein [Gammaproteobacteria bacterium]|nr:EVE domain-containing protein [Gammaproteobacteria bacterium]
MNYWLFKSEPTTFSIDTLEKRPKQTEPWDGVRNFQARNMLRDEIKVGDQGFFYHSSCEPPGIAGIVTVVKKGYPDATAWDESSKYYDPTSTLDKPKWFCVDVKLTEKFPRFLSLTELKQNPALVEMIIFRKGNRLSITPVTAKQWRAILKMAK